MSYLVVCPLAEIEAVALQHRPHHMVSLLDGSTRVKRPAMVAAQNHLFLPMNDISQPQAGMVLAGASQVQVLLDFADRWAQQEVEHFPKSVQRFLDKKCGEKRQPLLIHCWLGISRSTAAAFIIACRLLPERNERQIAHELRFHAPFATPNARLVALADDILGRDGRMIAAIKQIGRGVESARGTAFILNALAAEIG